MLDIAGIVLAPSSIRLCLVNVLTIYYETRYAADRLDGVGLGHDHLSKTLFVQK